MKKELTETSVIEIGEELKKEYDLSSLILLSNRKDKPTQVLGYINGNKIVVLKNITTTLLKHAYSRN